MPLSFRYLPKGFSLGSRGIFSKRFLKKSGRKFSSGEIATNIYLMPLYYLSAGKFFSLENRGYFRENPCIPQGFQGFGSKNRIWPPGFNNFFNSSNFILLLKSNIYLSLNFYFSYQRPN